MLSFTKMHKDTAPETALVPSVTHSTSRPYSVSRWIEDRRSLSSHTIEGVSVAASFDCIALLRHRICTSRAYAVKYGWVNIGLRKKKEKSLSDDPQPLVFRHLQKNVENVFLMGKEEMSFFFISGERERESESERERGAWEGCLSRIPKINGT